MSDDLSSSPYDVPSSAEAEISSRERRMEFSFSAASMAMRRSPSSFMDLAGVSNDSRSAMFCMNPAWWTEKESDSRYMVASAS